ncbi:glycosyltransferase [Clostridium sp. CM027]|uniref:glycosyltransferase family 2 protein n=1 Tax=Clostridium sp. CM027 TaxID=2849865 RepID=UPI001C6F3209|nr:glycosyltransferase [Clostridium sp. CM027]MBW9145262.1 glycosyltransferase [Clostridium sp. CM027]UVE40393.1 glycosyltransferase [Clostridium sp. CM027]
MEDINLSIIVPVYKTERYLEQCLDSIVNQTLKNFEIIIVNDGSPDDSEVVIKRFLEKYSNIKYLKKINGGLSSARNLGIKNAKGKFIGFVDSDDYIDINMYGKMFEKALENNSDIVICDMKYDLNGIDVSDTQFKDFGILDKNQTLLKYLNNTYFRSHAQNKIYNRKLFDNILFPEGKLFEDVATFYKLVHNSKKISFINEKLYCYNQGNMNSITKKKFNVRNVDLIDNSLSMMKFFEENRYTKCIIQSSKEMYFLSVKNLIIMLYSSKKHMSNTEFRTMKKYILDKIKKDIYKEGLNIFYKNKKCSFIKYNCFKIKLILHCYNLNTLVKSLYNF